MPWALVFRNFAQSRSSPQLSDLLLRDNASLSSGLTRNYRDTIHADKSNIGLHGMPHGMGKKRWSNELSTSSTVTSSVDDAADEHGAVAEFFQAISAGNRDVAKSLMRNNIDLVHSRNRSGKTAIHVAVVNENFAVLQDLLDNKADINAVDNEGNTALHLAAAKNDGAAIAALLASQANPKIKNGKQDTALHVAVRGQCMDALSKLLNAASLDINTPGFNGETPVHIAGCLNHVAMLDLLIRRRASVCHGNDQGLTVLHLAAAKSANIVLRHILQDGNTGYTVAQLVSVEDDEKGTPLHAAVHGGNMEGAALLLANKASVEAQTVDGTTPLHVACSQGSVEMVQMICASVEDEEKLERVLAMKDHNGLTPLHRAAIYNHVDLIEILIQTGAPVDAQDKTGNTPLISAATRAAEEAILELIYRGADVTIKNNDKKNFLHYVIIGGADQSAIAREINNNDLFTKLLNEKDKNGCTPLHYAAESGFGTASEELIRMGAAGDIRDGQSRSPLHVAAALGRYNTAKKLLETSQGMSTMNAYDRQGNTPLHLAAAGGHCRVVQLLLTNGALIHKNFMGKTALHLATVENSRESCSLLLKSYAYLARIQDREQNSALHDAAEHNASDCIDFLLTAGTELVRSKSGATALDVAIFHKNEAAVSAMMEHARWDELLAQPSQLYQWPILGLIKELPDVVQNILDRCQCSTQCHPLSPAYSVVYDFRVLEPGHCHTSADNTGKKPKSMETMDCIVKHGRLDLLSHPVCKHYLDTKWTTYGIYFHFVNLLVYIVFLAMLTFLLLRGLETELRPHMTRISLQNLLKYKPDFNQTHFGPVPLVYDFDQLAPVSQAFLTVILIFTACQLFKKILQIYLQGCKYFFRLANYMEVVLYVAALCFAIGLFDTNDRYMPWRVQWILGAVAAFFSWINLILHFQRYGKLGVYVNIFFRGLKVYFKAVSVYFIMVIAFSITFCVLNPEKIVPNQSIFFQVDHKDDDPNNYLTASVNLASSIIRISDMLVGDVDAIQNYITPLLSDMLVFPAATYFLALVTVGMITLLIQAILMNIVVQNLQEVERNASLNMLAMLVKLHTDLEEKLPSWFLRRVRKQQVRIFPNASRWKSFQQWLKKLSVGGLDELDQGGSAVGNGDDVPERCVSSTLLVQNIHEQRSKLRSLNGRMDQHRELLRNIVQRMEINMEADVVDDPTSAQRRISRYAVPKQPRPRALWNKVKNAQMLKSALKRKVTIGERDISVSIDE
ncbi:transient receptor potential cation channel subfamily A member 1-like [Paramacrobiotus metropolitanus]|uniref:transient receptor potential cation channel subfamily A member 1-like n=1 Tax=Paramacrobiotus metropolitanus TaxID=2943436 RepID=UPI00244610CD|nr:transient receptor potential cation channel subfamily A member 1-like [Paramacrobiotus metropolitanus]